jgi:lipopolysaccharide export system permease protein
MNDGTVQKFNYEDSKTEILNFDDYVFNLTENHKSENAFYWKAKERYLHELINPEEDSKEEDLAKYRAEINQRIAYPLLPIIFSIIAAASILRGNFNRRGNISNIILGISMAVIFLLLTIISCDLIEKSSKFTPLLYLNFIVFFTIGLNLLSEKRSQKK